MDAKKIVTISIGALVATIGIVKIVSGKAPVKVSTKWYERLSDAELNAKREMVRQEFCSSGKDYNRAVRLENLLRILDKELSKRAWGGRTDYGFPVHSEHGWHLPSED